MSREDKYDSQSDHDLLIELNVKQDELSRCFTNHLHHHWVVSITALSAALAAGLGFIASIMLLMIKSGIFANKGL